MTFYTSATAAAWIVPKAYVDKVGDEGFKKAPIGAGPYKFVSFTPGLELTMEAFEGFWRKKPSVERLIFRVIPDEVHPAWPPSSAARSISPTRSAASLPRRSSAARACPSSRR